MDNLYCRLGYKYVTVLNGIECALDIFGGVSYPLVFLYFWPSLKKNAIFIAQCTPKRFQQVLFVFSVRYGTLHNCLDTLM